MSRRGHMDAALGVLVLVLAGGPLPTVAAQGGPLELTAPRTAAPDTTAEEAPLPPPRSGFESGRRGKPASWPEGLRPGQAARLRILENDLRLLGVQGGRGLTDGIVSLVGGGLLLGLAMLFEDEQSATYLYLMGGSSAARGLMQLFLAPDPEEAAVALDHMPGGTAEQSLARLQFAEAALQDVATRSRWLRLGTALLDMAVAAAVVPLFLAPIDYDLGSPLSYFVLIGASVSFVGGAVALFTPTQAERRWDAYVGLRRRLAEEAP